MDNGVFIGLIGAILTLVFGMITIVPKKKKIKLSFVLKECLSLFDSIIEKIDGIEIKYNEKAINKSIIFFSGIIYNSGKQDIDKSIIYESLSLNVSDRYKLLEAKIDSAPLKSNVSIQIINNYVAIFNWDLIKSQESIGFTILLQELNIPAIDEVSNSKSDFDDEEFLEEIQFDHRITNLGKVKREKISRTDGDRRLEYLFWFMGLFGLAFLFFSLHGLYGELFRPKAEKYQKIFTLIDKDNLEQKGSFEFDDSEYNIKFKNKDSNEVDLFSPTEFNDNIKITQLDSLKTTPSVNHVMMILYIYIAIICLYLIYFAVSAIKERSLREIVEYD